MKPTNHLIFPLFSYIQSLPVTSTASYSILSGTYELLPGCLADFTSTTKPSLMFFSTQAIKVRGQNLVVGM